MIVNPRHIQRWTFRILVLGIFLSVVYDLIWLLIFNDINNDVDDGGLEKPVRIFSMLVAYLQLFFKVIQILILLYRSSLPWYSGRTPLTMWESFRISLMIHQSHRSEKLWADKEVCRPPLEHPLIGAGVATSSKRQPMMHFNNTRPDRAPALLHKAPTLH